MPNTLNRRIANGLRWRSRRLKRELTDLRRRLSTRSNPLEKYFEADDGRLIFKWLHYFDIYHRHLAKFRGKPIVVVEFGVFQGGSLQMWRKYFGKRAKIYGVDIDPRCKEFAEPGIEVILGDQEDREFLRGLAARVGPIDVLIDDGGHTMGQQIATYEELYPHVKAGGVYLIEDLHTSYWPKYGGGYRTPGTFIEYAKDLTDQLNAWHSRDKTEFSVDAFTRSTRSMHFYDSVIVFEKETVAKPSTRKTGHPSW